MIYVARLALALASIFTWIYPYNLAEGSSNKSPFLKSFVQNMEETAKQIMEDDQLIAESRRDGFESTAQEIARDQTLMAFTMSMLAFMDVDMKELLIHTRRTMATDGLAGKFIGYEQMDELVTQLNFLVKSEQELSLENLRIIKAFLDWANIGITEELSSNRELRLLEALRRDQVRLAAAGAGTLGTLAGLVGATVPLELMDQTILLGGSFLSLSAAYLLWNPVGKSRRLDADRMFILRRSFLQGQILAYSDRLNQEIQGRESQQKAICEKLLTSGVQ